MAAQTCDTNLDFDIDEDLEINIYELVYNDYESCEIELENIDWDCFDFMEQDEQQELQISFINENDNHISKIVVNANSEHSAAGYSNSDTLGNIHTSTLLESRSFFIINLKSKEDSGIFHSVMMDIRFSFVIENLLTTMTSSICF